VTFNPQSIKTKQRIYGQMAYFNARFIKNGSIKRHTPRASTPKNLCMAQGFAENKNVVEVLCIKQCKMSNVYQDCFGRLKEQDGKRLIPLVPG
jgi:hypothetical protein